MTPAQLDHLRRIDAHLANLLSTAEKRSSGEWHKECHDNSFAHGCAVGDKKNGLIASRLTQGNAAFISSCAGNAEAGWRATRAAIKGLLATCEGFTFPDEDRPEAYAALQDILAAFPNI